MFGFDVATLVALSLGGYIVGTWLYKKDEQIEDRREAAQKVAGVLRSKGLTITPQVLEAYSRGDYSAVAKAVKEAATVLLNPAAADAEFEGIFEKMLASKLIDPEQRAKLQSRIVDTTKVVKTSVSA